jgi:MinD-like ATPase involved in chromosome partitioning or flagellar assembly
MAATVICMASAKGGSGKTVLTATFSAFLVALGKRVLMIDTDAATNGLTLMFLKETMVQCEVALSEHRVASGIYDGPLLSGSQPELVKTPSGVHLLPAAYQFKNTELVSVEDFEGSLRKALESCKENYDFIFLDAQAGSDSIAHVAMSPKYSHEVVIVSEYDPLSAAGVERLKGLFREDLTYGRTWILLNKMLPDFVQSFSDFMEVAKYASPIPWDADVVRAYARRKLALDLERGNEFTLAVVQTLRSILGDEIGTDLDGWLRSRVAALREPIQTQYQDAERELESLIRLQAKARLGEETMRQFSRGFAAVVGLGAGVASHYVLKVLISSFKVDDPLALAWRSLFVQWGVFAVFLVATYITVLRSLEKGSVERTEVEKERLDRQRETLKDRLKTLEVLKSADATVLLRTKPRVRAD